MAYYKTEETSGTEAADSASHRYTLSDTATSGSTVNLANLTNPGGKFNNGFKFYNTVGRISSQITLLVNEPREFGGIRSSTCLRSG